MLAGIVLAGGRSRRMGRDKSALTLPDTQQTLLTAAQQLLSPICNERVFISGGQHQNAIADTIDNGGPLAGLYAVITHLQANHLQVTELLVIPVDMPSLKAIDLKHLVFCGQTQQQACYFSQCFLPCYLPLTTKLTEYLITLFKQNNKPAQHTNLSVKRLLQHLQAQSVAKLDQTRLNNINTPQEWLNHTGQSIQSKV